MRLSHTARRCPSAAAPSSESPTCSPPARGRPASPSFANTRLFTSRETTRWRMSASPAFESAYSAAMSRSRTARKESRTPISTPVRLLPVVQWTRHAGLAAASVAGASAVTCSGTLRKTGAPWTRMSVRASTMPCSRRRA